MGSKILIIGSFAGSLINFRGDLIRELLARGNTVYASAPEASESLINQLADMGAVYVPMSMQRTGMNLFEDLRTLRELTRIVKENHIEVVISYTIKPVIYGSIAGRLGSAQCIVSIVTGVGYVFINRALKARLISIPAKLLLKLAFSFNHLVFFQNQDDQQLIQKQGLLNSTTTSTIINGSGVNTVQLVPLPFPDRFSFLMMARLVKDKGVREYSEACSIVREKHPDVRCLLVGFIDNGPDSITNADLDAWQADGSIEFLGEINDVNAVFEQCTVYVLPSYREGTPRSVLEAMAAGRPIITTDAPGCKETVVDGLNGYTVPVRSASELASKMLSLIENPHLLESMGTESRKLATEKYDVRLVNGQIIQGINDLSIVQL